MSFSVTQLSRQLTFTPKPSSQPHSSSSSSSLASRTASALSFIDSVATYVWIGLTAFMILSFVLIIRSTAGPSQRLKKRLALVAIALLIIATWTYPLYVGGFDDTDLVRALYANYAYAAAYAIVFIVVAMYALKYALYLLPVLPWLIIATVYVIAQLKDN